MFQNMDVALILEKNEYICSKHCRIPLDILLAKKKSKYIYILQLLLVKLISAVDIMNSLKYFLLSFYIFSTGKQLGQHWIFLRSKILKLQKLLECFSAVFSELGTFFMPNNFFFLINSFTSKYIRVGHIFNLFN